MPSNRSKTRSEPPVFVFYSLSLIIFSMLAVGMVAAQDDSAATADTLEVPLTIEPVTSLLASDHIYDNGDGIDLQWVPSIDDQLVDGKVTGYEVYRSDNGGNPQKIAVLNPGANSYLDESVSLDNEYVYYVLTLSDSFRVASVRTAPLRTVREWVNFDLKFLFLMALIIGGAIVFFIESAKRGKKFYVRKIAGLEAVDEAIGRATEMGRPILFIPGIHDMDDVQTLASLTILGHVSRQVANYDTKIMMPVARSLVMTAARETIKAGYQMAGRPDAYSDDMVSYITDEQFGYVAAVDGIMVREKPATVFLLGAFFAESLILAETGNSVGAIQIAGTARPAQLPFFIAACDFTLIGEELFAASAYLSGEPKQLGSLKGQDVGKALALGVILLGVILATLFEMTDVEQFEIWLNYLKMLFLA